MFYKFGLFEIKTPYIVIIFNKQIGLILVFQSKSIHLKLLSKICSRNNSIPAFEGMVSLQYANEKNFLRVYAKQSWGGGSIRISWKIIINKFYVDDFNMYMYLN